jgi:hypothetical protein
VIKSVCCCAAPIEVVKALNFLPTILGGHVMLGGHNQLSQAKSANLQEKQVGDRCMKAAQTILTNDPGKEKPYENDP